MKKYTLFIAILILVLFSACGSLGIRDIPVKKAETKYADQSSKFMEVDGFRIHYRDEGKGKTLLLIHGAMSSLQAWDEWVKILGDKFRIIRLDMPGFGLTGGPNKEFVYNSDNIIKVIDDFIIKMGVNRFSIVGNSFGGYLAWNYTYRHPDKIEKMILIDSAGYTQKPPFPMRLFAMPVIGYFSTVITPRFIVASNVRDLFGDQKKATDKIIDRYFELMLRKGNRDEARKIFRIMVEKASDKNVSMGLSEIKNPTLIIWGGNDLWVPVEHVKQYRRDIPHAEIIIYKGVGHNAMEEIPEKSAEDALKFLMK